MKEPLLEFTSKGLYCAQGKFYIDPRYPVEQALITHAHADHAYAGHKKYLAHSDTLSILRYRLRQEQDHFYGIEYGETLLINGVKVSFHPAGHIIGSSQIRVEANNQIWVASGDYKMVDDGISIPFEPIACDVFITESTFGLPCFQWDPQESIFADIQQWRRHNQSLGLNSIIFGYALGKSQRVLNGIDPSIGPVFAHGAIWNLTEIIRQLRPKLPPLTKIEPHLTKNSFKGALILAPPSAINSSWLNRFHPYSTSNVSGWMALRGIRRRKGVDKGFVLSDHADWLGLQSAIKATGAKKIIVTHGFTAEFARWLQEQGYEAQDAKVNYQSIENEEFYE